MTHTAFYNVAWSRFGLGYTQRCHVNTKLLTLGAEKGVTVVYSSTSFPTTTEKPSGAFVLRGFVDRVLITIIILRIYCQAFGEITTYSVRTSSELTG